MRVIVTGGTRFIGRGVLWALHESGHDALVIHRGRSEPEELPPFPHLHCEFSALADHSDAISKFAPDALVDTASVTAASADNILTAVPGDLRLVALSSLDVYAAYAAVMSGGSLQEGPITERSPVRDQRYPFRGSMPGMDEYENLDVEDRYLQRGGTIFRLPMVFGEYDYQRREEPVLRRIRAGRRKIPTGPGTWRVSRLYAPDVGKAVVAALERPQTDGEIFNLGEQPTLPIKEWLRSIVEAAGSDIELVDVPEEVVPDDLGATRTIPQDLDLDTSKAQELLSWAPTAHVEAVRRSVAWHLEHPPESGMTEQEIERDESALTSG